jgi:biopolymer transport protein ExbD
LLILFILTLPVMTNNTTLDLPQTPPPQPQPAREAISLGIEFDGTIVWNGTPIDSFEQLEGYFLTEAMQPTQAELHVRPDRRVKYDTVAKVLALAQRSGIERIGFTGQEQLLD